MKQWNLYVNRQYGSLLPEQQVAEHQEILVKTPDRASVSVPRSTYIHSFYFLLFTKFCWCYFHQNVTFLERNSPDTVRIAIASPCLASPALPEPESEFSVQRLSSSSEQEQECRNIYFTPPQQVSNTPLTLATDKSTCVIGQQLFTQRKLFTSGEKGRRLEFSQDRFSTSSISRRTYTTINFTRIKVKFVYSRRTVCLYVYV